MAWQKCGVFRAGNRMSIDMSKTVHLDVLTRITYRIVHTFYCTCFGLLTLASSRHENKNGVLFRSCDKKMFYHTSHKFLRFSWLLLCQSKPLSKTGLPSYCSRNWICKIRIFLAKKNPPELMFWSLPTSQNNPRGLQGIIFQNNYLASWHRYFSTNSTYVQVN